MNTTLTLALEQARRSELRSVDTEVTAVGALLVVRATIALAAGTYTAHAVAENAAALGSAEEEAILRACRFAGVATVAPAAAAPPPLTVVPRPAEAAIFDSRPLIPEPDSFTFEEPDEPVELIDRESLMEESSRLMAAIGMDNKSGRNHLQTTYNKRMRGELTDDELLSFVEYLRAQQHTRNSPQLPF